MAELLAPAGTMEALKAAVNSGCDAVYLGMSRFGARAYATNFNYETLKEALDYCHSYNVALHVTMNTIVFEDELNDAYEQIKKLYEMGVDAIIIQDLALVDYLKKHCPEMECHASTQQGLDDEYGALQAHLFGADRVVLGRECSLERIKRVKEVTKLPVEVFGHGALCVSYSGNCLMSGLLGYRSGNRGRCVGSCRKPYELIDKTNNESLGQSYILSMKDLCTIENIKDLDFVDSIKIEGRMKEPEYVANVVKHYRYQLDNNELLPNTIHNLSKTFNRTFTKGYIYNTDKADVINTKRPNHHGYLVGYISKIIGKMVEITLNLPLNQNDMIRIEGPTEINYPVVKLYDENKKLINKALKKCYIYLDEKVRLKDKVYISNDVKYMEMLSNEMKIPQRKVKLDIYLEAKIGLPLAMTLVCGDRSIHKESDFIVVESKNKTLSYESLNNQLQRLGDTPYIIDNIHYNIDLNSFIPNSKLNELRRNAINDLTNERLKVDRTFIFEEEIEEINPVLSKRGLACFCTTLEQKEACEEEGIEVIYFDNFIKRNEAKYIDNLDLALIGGYGGVYYYKNKDTYTVSDFSLNVVNSKSVYLLHKAGVDRVTLSHEMNKKNIQDLINNFKKNYNSSPNLEMIIYGHAHLLNTKYCPLKINGLCGKCKKNQYVIKDNYGEFPIISHNDCTTTIVNGKILNLLDEINNFPPEITKLRLQFTIESKEEVKEIIKLAKLKMEGLEEKTFNSDTQTRGHFNREIL